MRITTSKLLSKLRPEACDPKRHLITFCIDYKGERCPETCWYARRKNNYQEATR